MINIYLLCGGISSEHEISLRSAANIYNNLDKEKYKINCYYIDKKGVFNKIYDLPEKPQAADFQVEGDDKRLPSIANFLKDYEKDNQMPDKCLVIPCIHGTYGEDGTIQGFLETLGVNYLGNGILASAICMDKAVCNSLLEAAGIKKCPFDVVYREDYEDEKRLDQTIEKLGLPLFVKPANGGSSVGVSRVDKREEFKPALNRALKYDDKVLVEAFVEGVELEVSVIGNKDPQASLPGAYVTEKEFFDYEAKYSDQETLRIIPYDLSKEKASELQRLCTRAYKALGLRGFCRIDTFMTKDGEFLINEINTFPGMTPSSLSADLWQVTNGMKMPELLDKLVQYTLETGKEKNHLSHDKESQ